MTCLNCKRELQHNNRKYCNNKCQSEFQYKEYIDKWHKGEVTGLRGKYQVSKHIVKYLFEKYTNKCSHCGWGEYNKYTRTIPLEVEHIDGNFSNNNEENLLLLCPNCHSLTPTYKGANKGNGRKDRQKYSLYANPELG